MGEGFRGEIKTVLNFFRHGEKDGDKLTQKGRMDAAIGEGKKFRNNSTEGVVNKPAVAVGGPFKRSQEASILSMQGGELSTDEISGYSTLDDIKTKVNEDAGLELGSKSRVDARLDFRMTGEAFEQLKKALGEKRMLEWIVNESDNAVAGQDPEKDWGYSRMAANFAELIQRYTKAATNFDRLVKSKDEKEENFTHLMERYFGSHSPSVDSFLVKLIQKTKGEDVAQQFVQLNRGGIKELEGFQVEIVQKNNEPVVKVTYKPQEKSQTEFSFSEEVKPEVLEEIIAEGGGHMDFKGRFKNE